MTKEFITIEAGELEGLLTQGEYQEYLHSVLKHLPDQRIQEAAPQQDFQAMKKHFKAMEAAARDASNSACELYLQANPAAKGLLYKHTGKVVSGNYSEISYAHVFSLMLDCILENRLELATQRAILESVKYTSGFSRLNANIWKIPLKSFFYSKAKARCKAYGLNVQLTGCTDMSAVRKAIIAAYNKTEAQHRAKLDITLTASAMVINGVSHTICTTTSGNSTFERIRVNVGKKRPWIRLDTLGALLGIPIN